MLGRVSESQHRRRVRIQIILTRSSSVANLIGIGVATLVVTVAFPTPSVFDTAGRAGSHSSSSPAYIGTALVVGRVLGDPAA